MFLWLCDNKNDCNTLQRTARSQDDYTQCKTLQHTATHCNTLQHTATHCVRITRQSVKSVHGTTHVCLCYRKNKYLRHNAKNNDSENGCVFVQKWIYLCRQKECVCDIIKSVSDTGWRRLSAFLKVHVIFRKRATNYRALLRKMTYEDKASYDSTPPYNASVCEYYYACS